MANVNHDLYLGSFDAFRERLRPPVTWSSSLLRLILVLITKHS